MTLFVAPIVEGHGEVNAARPLLHRLNPACVVARPIRVPRTKMLKPDEMARYLQLAKSNLPSDPQAPAVILVIFDADKDCPAQLGPSLISEFRARIDRAVQLCIANRGFESWLIAGRPDGFGDRDEDRTGNLKAWMKERDGHYRETVDQAKWAAQLDADLAASRSTSFRRLRDLIAKLGGQ